MNNEIFYPYVDSNKECTLVVAFPNPQYKYTLKFKTHEEAHKAMSKLSQTLCELEKQAIQ